MRFALKPACRFVVATLVAACFVSAPHDRARAEEHADKPPLFYAGRIAGDEHSTRVYFDIDRRIEFSTFLMDNPERLVVDGPAMLFRFASPEDLDPRGLVSFLRYGAIARERSRIVLTLSGPARIADISQRPIRDGKASRLVIDLAAVSRPEFEAVVNAQPERETAFQSERHESDAPATPKEQGRFRIVIDPGHGGIDSGAIGANGTMEKDLALKMARLIGEQIRAAGPFETLLTREEDIFVSLSERVAFSRRHEADLIISVHADSLRQNWVRGTAIYTLSNTASDELAAELAESERMTDILAGLENPVEEEAVSGILADLTARETKIFSTRFSRTLASRLKTQLNMLKNPLRSASFAVLKAPEVPGVLLELGYLSNAEDEKMMVDPKWQEEAAALIAKAVAEFFESRI